MRAGIATADSAEQPRKAQPPISVTELGVATGFTFVVLQSVGLQTTILYFHSCTTSF
eukprot:SAG22_NODE_7212_length_761_cov_1.261329_2_plen_56_part_01